MAGAFLERVQRVRPAESEKREVPLPRKHRLSRRRGSALSTPARRSSRNVAGAPVSRAARVKRGLSVNAAAGRLSARVSIGTGRSVCRCSPRFLWLPVTQVEVVARTHGYWNELRQVYDGARDGLPAALGTKELRMFKQPPDLLISAVATVRAPDLVLQVIEHCGSAQACRSDGEARTDVGGGKIEGRRGCSCGWAGRHRPTLTRRSTEYPTDCRALGIFPRGQAAQRSPRRFVPRATVAAADPRVSLDPGCRIASMIPTPTRFTGTTDSSSAA